ncbi:hypothetical protein AVEN_12662-1 [Araneus ventricosus]|uniref:Uncharacterized protein n=1 Tax=Araneus ventricosus TaxID=182803 RepID=A0A4Y2ACK6_ARAVE|nr:hypothetical protein AVEN_12662-1 [Araneus ventricosus]
MKAWTIEHCVFTFGSFVKKNESVSAFQREFRRHFNMHRNQAVSTRVAVLCWILALRTRGTLMKKRLSGLHVPLNMLKASCKPCCAVRIDLLGSILLNLTSVIVR